MPSIRVNGAQIDYSETGSGPETVVFAHGLLMNRSMYDAQMAALSADYRCIAYDHRGQGRSEVTKSGYDMDSVAADAADLIRGLGAAPCHFVGMSMGGFIALRLAIRYPGLLRSLTLIDTSADPENPGNARKYRALIRTASVVGLRPLTGFILPMMFGRSFMRDPARKPERELWKKHMLEADRKGALRASRGVNGRPGVHEHLGRIQTPALIIVGDEDQATPPLCSERMRDSINGARLVLIPGAGHCPPIEKPDKVTRAIADFLKNRPGRRRKTVRRSLPATAGW